MMAIAHRCTALAARDSRSVATTDWRVSCRLDATGVAEALAATWALRYLMTGLVLAGREDEARKACRRLVQAVSGLTLSKELSFSSEAADQIVDGLKRAGHPLTPIGETPYQA